MKTLSRKISAITMGLISLTIAACVDDYTDANPKTLLDAPTIRITSTSSNQAVATVAANQFQNTYEAYASYGSPVQYTVNVIDAPGTIGEISVSASVPEFGSVALNQASADALQGQETGSFNFTFTPNQALDPADGDRSLNIVVNVSDNQGKTTSVTFPLTLVNSTCFTSGIAGQYRVKSATGNRDGGITFNLDTLKKYYPTPHVIVQVTEQRPGLVTLDEITGGLWPLFYPTRANPSVDVDLCGSTIAENNLIVGGIRRFVANGTVNSDNTITITWSYTRIDGNPTPASPAKGTFVLERF
jgi:hypothetical protein